MLEIMPTSATVVNQSNATCCNKRSNVEVRVGPAPGERISFRDAPCTRLTIEAPARVFHQARASCSTATEESEVGRLAASVLDNLQHELYSNAYMYGRPEMDAMTYTAVRANLASTMDRVCDDHEALIITRNGEQAVVMLARRLQSA